MARAIRSLCDDVGRQRRAAECSDLRAVSATSRRHPSPSRCSATPPLPTGQPLCEAHFRRRVLLCSRGRRGSRFCRRCPCPPRRRRRRGESSARAHAARSRMVPSSDRKARRRCRPRAPSSPVVPMDSIGQFHGTFFGRTASSSSIAASATSRPPQNATDGDRDAPLSDG